MFRKLFFLGCLLAAGCAGPTGCPECGEAETIPIVYGKPGPGLMEAADRGEVVLGGCVVYDGMPTAQCAHCRRPYAPAP